MARKAKRPVPEGMNTITTHLWFNGDCREAIEFYKTAFRAEQVGNISLGPDGKVLHAMLQLGNSHIMLADAMPELWEKGPTDTATAGIWLYVEDCDALYNRAVNAGCEVLWEMMDAFWGDRMGKVKDPYGHCWSIASQKWELTEDEIRQAQAEWFATIGARG